MGEDGNTQLIAFAALGLGIVALVAAYVMQRSVALERRNRYPYVAGGLALIGLILGRRLYAEQVNVEAYLYWMGVAALAVAGAVFVLPELKSFLLQVREELRKVVWPSKEDTQSFTLVVLVAVAVVALYVGFLDLFLTKLVAGLHIYGR
ncbi:MAG: preprotein translocase subunit SecE [Armatimonadota bacterium]